MQALILVHKAHTHKNGSHTWVIWAKLLYFMLQHLMVRGLFYVIALLIPCLSQLTYRDQVESLARLRVMHLCCRYCYSEWADGALLACGALIMPLCAVPVRLDYARCMHVP